MASSNCTTVVHQCISPMKPTSNGVFQGDNPLNFSLPLMILQICLVVSLTRLLGLVLKPLRQPRVIAEIIGGILLGPLVLGRNKAYLHTIFPPGSLPVLDTLANIGLIFFLFLVGIELDPKALARTGKRILAIALAGISLPFALGIGSSFVFRNTISKDVNAPAFIVFMGVAFSITAFPVLARILAELKLLTTDVGKMAMSAAAVNDVAAWILLALAVALSGVGHSPLVCLWVLLSGCGFVLIATLVFRPIFTWIAGRLQEGEPVSESYICATLTAVLAAGFITDAIGIHALFGAFVLGILVPKEGPFANALVLKVEDLVTGLFLPLYFASSGLKTNVATIQGLQSWGLLALVIVTACLGKIIGTVFVSRACKVPWRESLVLGFLMNSKGLVELIVLNIGKDRKVLNDQTFAIMVLMALFTTFITTPLVLMIYSPSKRLKEKEYKHRTIEREDTTSQLRILACFHDMKNIPTLVNLIEASRGTERKESLCLYALHLTELSERSSSILMVNKARKLQCWNKERQDTDQIMITFKDFQQLSHVSIKPMASISSMSDMHEDICASAEKKRVAMVILPFHMHQRLDGVLETTRAEVQRVNEKVLENAKCSVGILVDRGLGGNIHISGADVSSSVTVIFFGGPDDREALSYAVHMAEHPGIALTVIRVYMENGALRENSVIDVTDKESRTTSLSLDDEITTRLRKKIEEKLMQYAERRVRNAAEIVAIVRNYRNCNLFIVGRMQKNVVGSCLTGESAYQELGPMGSYCQELGPVGSYLASNDFSTRASVLIVQQYYRETASTISQPQSEVTSNIPQPRPDVTSNIPQPRPDVSCETNRQMEMIRVR